MLFLIVPDHADSVLRQAVSLQKFDALHLAKEELGKGFGLFDS